MKNSSFANHFVHLFYFRHLQTSYTLHQIVDLELLLLLAAYPIETIIRIRLSHEKNVTKEVNLLMRDVCRNQSRKKNSQPNGYFINRCVQEFTFYSEDKCIASTVWYVYLMASYFIHIAQTKQDPFYGVKCSLSRS